MTRAGSRPGVAEQARSWGTVVPTGLVPGGTGSDSPQSTDVRRHQFPPTGAASSFSPTGVAHPSGGPSGDPRSGAEPWTDLSIPARHAFDRCRGSVTPRETGQGGSVRCCTTPGLAALNGVRLCSSGYKRVRWPGSALLSTEPFVRATNHGWSPYRPRHAPTPSRDRSLPAARRPAGAPASGGRRCLRGARRPRGRRGHDRRPGRRRTWHVGRPGARTRTGPACPARAARAGAGDRARRTRRPARRREHTVCGRPDRGRHPGARRARAGRGRRDRAVRPPAAARSSDPRRPRGPRRVPDGATVGARGRRRRAAERPGDRRDRQRQDDDALRDARRRPAHRADRDRRGRRRAPRGPSPRRRARGTSGERRGGRSTRSRAARPRGPADAAGPTGGGGVPRSRGARAPRRAEHGARRWRRDPARERSGGRRGPARGPRSARRARGHRRRPAGRQRAGPRRAPRAAGRERIVAAVGTLVVDEGGRLATRPLQGTARRRR